MRQFNNKKIETVSNKMLPQSKGQKKVPQFLLQKKSPETNRPSQSSNGPISLQQEYRQVKTQLLKKQAELQNKEKMYRIESFKNHKLKQSIQEIDRHFDMTKYKITLQTLQKNKNNKDSPLFYNQNGLCPFELVLIQEKRYQSSMEEGGFICMICFQDIQENQPVVYLPCEHTFHKDCGVQHLLGSKICPNCNQQVDVKSFAKNKIQRQQKKLELYM